MIDNEKVWSSTLAKLKEQPLLINDTHEILNAHLVFNPVQRLKRAYKIYCDEELAWYKSMDLNINNHKGIEKNPIWKDCCAPNGNVNSNYGYLVWSAGNGDQFKHAVYQLLSNRMTRQSVCIYTRPSIQLECNDNIHAKYDFICTFETQHFIRNNCKLEYIVYMRSNDIIHGTPYDLAWHQYLYNMMFMQLSSKYPIRMGHIYWNVGSLHLYERDNK